MATMHRAQESELTSTSEESVLGSLYVLVARVHSFKLAPSPVRTAFLTARSAKPESNPPRLAPA